MTNRRATMLRRPLARRLCRGRLIIATSILGVGLVACIRGSHGAEPQAAGNAVRLVEGRFGQALDAGTVGFLAPADPRFSRLPITVEFWVRRIDPSRSAILLSNEGRDSGTHWELSAERPTGALELRIPGFQPSVVPLGAALSDPLWHHITLILEQDRVRAYVDGKRCLDSAVTRTALPTLSSGLGLGTAVEDRKPSPVLIDDVRISDVARDVVATPGLPLVSDEHTIALWSFDESEAAYLAKWTPGGETNQRGLPYPHRYAEYEFEMDPQWVDGRWQATDKGPFLTHSIQVPRRATGPKGMVVFLNREGTTGVLFDPERCAAVVGLSGARLTVSDLRYGLETVP